jgi:hypothetical protein
VAIRIFIQQGVGKGKAHSARADYQVIGFTRGH